jgi:sugar phosphate isomerase/epimerase
MALGSNDLVVSHFTLTGTPPMTTPRFSFAERVAAASEAGFAGIGVLGDDYAAEQEAGLTDKDALAILDDHGLELAEVEFLYEWSAGPDEPERVAFAQQLEDRVWAIADAFGPRVVSVGELGTADAMPPFDVLVERFAALCDRAGEHGLLVALEFMPWTGIPDVSAAAKLVDAVDRANAGLNVDAWHYYRSGGGADTLANIADRVHMIQLDDADAELVGELFEDTMLRRRYPGEGSFDFDAFFGAIDRGGTATPVSVEILSAEHQALPVKEAARRAHDSTRAAVDTARAASKGI